MKATMNLVSPTCSLAAVRNEWGGAPVADDDCFSLWLIDESLSEIDLYGTDMVEVVTSLRALKALRDLLTEVLCAPRDLVAEVGEDSATQYEWSRAVALFPNIQADLV